jgi:DnaJ-class molecular chaperone
MHINCHALIQAIKCHPDKNPDDPTASDRFKEIAVAYATLSDPSLRHSYNEYGKGKGDGQDDEAMVDPEMIFSQLFGGESFKVPWSSLAPRNLVAKCATGPRYRTSLVQSH